MARKDPNLGHAVSLAHPLPYVHDIDALLPSFGTGDLLRLLLRANAKPVLSVCPSDRSTVPTTHDCNDRSGILSRGHLFLLVQNVAGPTNPLVARQWKPPHPHPLGMRSSGRSARVQSVPSVCSNAAQVFAKIPLANQGEFRVVIS